MTVNLSALAGAGQQFLDANANPLTGGKLYSYEAGTTTPQITYTTAAGSVAHANPIILDSAGRVPGGQIWLSIGLNYKFVLTSSTDTLIGTWDNITGINGTGINTNASLIAYDPTGSGAVTTTVQAKLRETVSVKDFGAVGDGVTDDTAAIQAAIDYVVSLNANRPAIFLPAGTYLISSNLTIGTNVASQGIRIFGEGKRSKSTIQASSSVTKVFEFLAATAPARHENVQLENFSIVGSIGNTEYGIYAPYSAHGTYRSIRIQYTFIAAIDVGYAFCSVFNDLELVNNQGDGFVCTSSGGQANQIIFTGCKIFLNDGLGVKIRDSYAIGFYTCLFESCKKGGAFVGGNSKNITFDTCYFEANSDVGYTFTSPTTFSVKADIIINGAGTDTTISQAFSSTVKVSNCFVSPSSGQECFVFGNGANGLVIENCRNNSVSIFPDLVRYFGSISTTNATASYGAPNNLTAKTNVNFEEQFKLVNFPFGIVAYNESALTAKIDQAQKQNIAETEFNVWINRATGSGGSGAWQRSAVTFPFNPNVPVWEIDATGFSGSSNAYAFQIDAANYPQYHSKFVLFGMWVKKNAVGAVSNVALLAKSIIDVNFFDANTEWQFRASVFEMPTSGLLNFGVRKIGDPDTVYVACPVLCEFGADVKALYGTFVNQIQFYGTAAPTIGTWKRGDMVLNLTPSAAGTPGWVCVTAGTPGTWKAMANVAA